MGASAAPPAICPVLAGPTAVGKTGLILRLARDYPIEVISLDSRQIYRGLRIGTAQPGPEELAACPHHLIDFLLPEDRYSAQRFRGDFRAAYLEIRSRGALPVLVGGAGMYLTAIREGFFSLPEDPRALAAIRAELDPLSDAEIRESLLTADPDSCRRIPPGDRYRSQRALEITRQAGRPMSELMAEHEPRPVLGLEFPLVVLERPRDELRERIAARTDAMLAGGWLEETAALLELHAPDTPGMSTLGYRQVASHLAGEIDRERMREQIVLRTRQYARRQRIWFRREARTDAGEPDSPRILAAVRRLVESAAG